MTKPAGGANSSAVSEQATTVHVFLIADVRGYTRFTADRGDEAAAKLAAKFATVSREGVGAHGGRVIELRGDEILAVFGSVRQALRAALDLQERYARESAEDPSLPLPVGIGIDAGEAVPVEGGYRGAALNLAARLCSLARPGEVLASEGAVLLARRTPGIAYVERGYTALKGFPRPIRVLRVVPEHLADGETSPPDAPPPQSDPIDDASDRAAGNLPAQSTPFVGRQRELATVRRRLLRADVHLLTLTGPGGGGKTRLGLQVAEEVRDQFADGVYFVPLASVSDPQLVPSSIAAALWMLETGSRSVLDTLKEYLRYQEVLLLLDNFEHVLGAAPMVGELIEAAPRLKVLVTSRAVLGVYGEYTYRVPPLALPNPKHLPPLDVLSQNEAVRLFVERAQATNPAFTLSEENAAAVAEICYRLDGLPLAIELAAARTRLLPPHAMLARLDRSLKLLTGGARNRPARQQTLRNAIDWSYRLLGQPDQRLFARLGVFVGSFTLEAADSVANTGGDLDVLEGVGALVDKSLVQPEDGAGDGDSRFSLLDTLREYALERLAEAGEAEDLRRRHAGYYLALAERADPELWDSQQLAWLHRLEAEHDNLRAALGWLLAEADAEACWRLVGALSRFWFLRGYFGEWDRWLEATRALRPGEQTNPLRAARGKAVFARGMLALYETDWVLADDLGVEGLSLYRRSGEDGWGIAACLALRGAAREDRGRLAESLALARDVGDPWLIAWVLHLLCDARLHEGEADARTDEMLEEGLALARQTGDGWLIARSLLSLGEAAESRRDPQRAATYYERSLELSRSLGDRLGIAYGLRGLSRAAYDREDYETAQGLNEERLTLERELGNKRGVTDSLASLAMTTLERGEYERAAAMAERSLELARELADERYLARALAHLGFAALLRGDEGRARALAEEGSALARGVGERWILALDLAVLGWALHRQGEYERARQAHEEGLALRRELGDWAGAAGAMEGLAAVALAQGRPERAARLLGAAQALRAAAGVPPHRIERALYEPFLAAARAELGDAAFEAMRAEGRSLPPDAAIEYARDRAS